MQDRAHLDALAPLSLFDAIGYVGATPWRPGENLFFWLIAHSGVMLPWRAGMLVVFLLTTAFIQYDAHARGSNWIDGLGAAACFSVNPTTFSVVCWLSGANVGLCAIGILSYFECSRRALDRDAQRGRYLVAAWASLGFALAFYELAALAPIAVVAWHRLLSARGGAHHRSAPALRGGAHHRSAPARLLYLGSAACVSGYILLQLAIAHPLRLWPGESPALLIANAMRYGVLNFWAWCYPFGTFGVLVPDDPTAHAAENAVCWLLGAAEVSLIWKLRRFDPTSAFGGIWFLLFLVPAGAFLHYDGSPIAQHHMYIPMLGMAYPCVRFITLSLERLNATIKSHRLRLLIGVPITLLLLWTLAPMLAECQHTVKIWGNEQQLYLTTLRNYPDSAEVLGRLTRSYLARTDARFSEPDEGPEPWQGFLDILLMRPAPDSASSLIHEGHTLIGRAQYVAAGSAFARALGAGTNRDEQLDASTTLVLALLHTDQRASARPLIERLRHDYPSHANLNLPAP